MSLFKLPTVRGLIERRMLINYRLDSKVAARLLPKPFRPQLIEEYALVGICLIRLVNMKPEWAPSWVGFQSENAAHRFAVTWGDGDQCKNGVYIPRRDTSSRLSSLAGDRFFPGKQNFSKFEIDEDGNNFNLSFQNKDQTSLSLKARRSHKMSENSVFNSIEAASAFYQGGSLGHSPKGDGSFQAVKLVTPKWSVSPLEVISVHSSYFEDKSVFPNGSIAFDNALLMENLEHSWEASDELNLNLHK